jgi:alkylation response protein AidB-like acyl-CoA dehydrogenase
VPVVPEEIEELRRVVRHRAETRIAPLIEPLDRSGAFSPELWSELKAMDVFALPFAEEHGGTGGSFLAFAVVIEQLARVGAVAGVYPGTTVQVAGTLLIHGTPDQRARWLPDLLTGEVPAAWAFTEPETGSDPAQIATRARALPGGGWELHGQKMFISFARQAGVALVFAAMDGGGLGAFLVEPGGPGWTVGPPVEVLGLAGTEAAAIHLDGVRVPDDALVGAPGAGFDVLLAGEAEGKVRASAVNVGIAGRAVAEATAYALGRLHRGRPIADRFPTVRALLGEMEAQVLGARAIVHDAARLVDQGGPGVAKVAAAARLVSGRCAREVTSGALQVCGAYGWTRDLPVERLYREGKFFEVTQGVAELQKIIVGGAVIAEVDPGRMAR